MKKERRTWVLPEPLRALPGLEAYSPVFRQILHGRSVTQPHQLDRWLVSDLSQSPDPFLLKDMARACDLIGDAVGSGRRIAVYGDYDADGVTACVTLARGLRSVGADVVTYIPNRFTEGYGLNGEALKELASRGVSLVITCDCGTNSVEVARDRPAGMQLIVTDHHEVGAERPPVDALVNPKQPDCPYPFDGLAACGVAYKMLVALEQRTFPGRLDPTASLDAVALGTVADVVPLHAENRAIVRAGLRRLMDAPGHGCAALLAVAGIKGAVTAEHLAFQLGPRINAAGRMEDAVLALDLLMADSREAAEPMAARLHEQNAQRQQLTAEIVRQARAQVAELGDDTPIIVMGTEDWPLGVLGLAASRLVEEFYRPTFIFNMDGDEWRGSARSIEGFHLVECLQHCAPLLHRFGGHAMAAGLTVRRDLFSALQECLRDYAAERLDRLAFSRPIKVEATASLADLKPSLHQEIQMLAPFGVGNREPLLISRDVEVLRAETFGTGARHLRLQLKDRTASAEAFAFDKGDSAAHLPRGRRIDVVYGLDCERWDGLDRVRLHLKDLRLSAVPAIVPIDSRIALRNQTPVLR
ncbi:MAG: single-stranded-DNA-specific exonuclease RecJ [Candidatus Dormibacteraeota bacterium]|nr:single-stranded-DNA-specific exonuclease RecJ [Candidatus Dormibacteraeota bacterium]